MGLTLREGYGTKICRCCSNSGRIRSPHTWPPLQRPTTWTGTHSSAAGRGYEPTRRVLTRVIVVDDEVAGTIGSWGEPGEREVTYWIGRSYWGKGIATDALNAFLAVERSRPLHARVASDNVASRRVLEKCGFRVIATERNVAEARSSEIEELVLRLDELASPG
jgi:RimJ/RimL family protein N-acetyltransferase